MVKLFGIRSLTEFVILIFLKILFSKASGKKSFKSCGAAVFILIYNINERQRFVLVEIELVLVIFIELRILKRLFKLQRVQLIFNKNWCQFPTSFVVFDLGLAVTEEKAIVVYRHPMVVVPMHRSIQNGEEEAEDEDESLLWLLLQIDWHLFH